MSKIRLRFAAMYALVGFWALCAYAATADEDVSKGGALPRMDFEPQVFELREKEDELEAPWRRPSDARFALVSGCGAGGDGGSNTSAPGGFFYAGKGGRSAPPQTILIGPLTDDVYTIRIYRGGSRATTLQGTGLALNLSPGVPGAKRDDPEEYVATAGDASIFGPGGPAAPPEKRAPRWGGVGGDAQAPCAGGGGGYDGGGRGGPGRLLIYPLPDLDRVFRILAVETAPDGKPSATPEESASTKPKRGAQ